MPRTLDQWLTYQERVNVRSIELGLDRVSTVWHRMGAAAPGRRVITVAGTNGKGSTVAFLEAIATAAGLRVGSFTSPHLIRYNERVRVAGSEVDDAELIASFEFIESSRGDIPLTYFEFGTLAALNIFARSDLGLAVLEVGLGGRLDAVNIVDADVAVITTVDLDHVDWLGPDRDSIGREKAGVARSGRPAIVGELDPPAGLLDALQACAAQVHRAGQDFQAQPIETGWLWQHRDGSEMRLPTPALIAPVQRANAAAAIAALRVPCADGGPIIPPNQWPDAAVAGLRNVRVPARLQVLGHAPELVVDVGHNPQAARALAQWLDTQPPKKTHAVYGALADKDIAGVIAALGARVDHWHLAGLEQDTPRGLGTSALADILAELLPTARFDASPNVSEALERARASTGPDQRILAFGSFFVASAVLEADSSDSRVAAAHGAGRRQV